MRKTSWVSEDHSPCTKILIFLIGHVRRRRSEGRLIALRRRAAIHHGTARDDAASEGPVPVAESRQKAVFVR